MGGVDAGGIGERYLGVEGASSSYGCRWTELPRYLKSQSCPSLERRPSVPGEACRKYPPTAKLDRRSRVSTIPLFKCPTEMSTSTIRPSPSPLFSPSSTPTPSVSYSHTPGSASVSRSNPLSARIYKVLSTSYDDRATHEALSVLSELYTPSASSSGTSNVETNRQGEGIDKIAVNATTIAVNVAAHARKNLKRDVELKLSQNSRQFLAALKDVDKAS